MLVLDTCVLEAPKKSLKSLKSMQLKFPVPNEGSSKAKIFKAETVRDFNLPSTQ